MVSRPGFKFCPKKVQLYMLPSTVILAHTWKPAERGYSCCSGDIENHRSFIAQLWRGGGGIILFTERLHPRIGDKPLLLTAVRHQQAGDAAVGISATHSAAATGGGDIMDCQRPDGNKVMSESDKLTLLPLASIAVGVSSVMPPGYGD